MNYKVTYSESGRYFVKVQRNLYPGNYLDAESEDELYDFVREDFYDNLTIGDVVPADADETRLELPQEFIDEWKHLKALSEKL